jgi:hypothetical protein
MPLAHGTYGDEGKAVAVTPSAAFAAAAKKARGSRAIRAKATESLNQGS